MYRLFKIVSSLGLLIAGLLTLITVYFLQTYDTSHLRPTLQQVARGSGFDLKIDGEINVLLFPNLGLSIDSIEIKFGKESHLRAEKLSLTTDWVMLFHIISSSRNIKSNQWIVDPKSIDLINDINLLNAEVHLNSIPLSKPILSDIQLGIDNISGQGDAFPVTLQVTVLEELTLNVTTSLGMDIQSQTIRIPSFEMSSELGNIEGQTLIDGASGAVNGTLVFSDINFFGLTELLKLQFPQFYLPKMKGDQSLTNIGATAEFDFISSEMAHLDGALSIDGQPLDFKLVSNTSNQNLQVLLSAKSFNLGNYFPKVEQSKPKTSKVQYSILLSPLAPLIMWPGETQIEIDIGYLKMNGFEISNMYADFSSFRSIIQLNSLNADLFGGYADLTGLVSLQKNIPRSELKINLHKISLASMLPAITGHSDTSGSLHMDLNIAFNGINLENLVNSAVGSGTISVMEPLYSKINLEQTLCSAVTLLGGAWSPKNWPKETPLQDLSADFEIRSGDLLVTKLISGSENIDLNLHGALDLRSKDYQFLLEARLNDGSNAQDSCFNKLKIPSQGIPFTCTGNALATSPPMCLPSIDAFGGVIKNRVLSDLLKTLSDL